MSEVKEKTLQERIELARAKRRAFDEAREQPSNEDLEAELAREERAAKDAEALHNAEKQHGKANRPDSKIAAVETDMGLVILRRADVTLFRKFMDQDTTNLQEAEKLTIPCVIYPAKDVFDRMLGVQPAIIIDCTSAVLRLMGVRRAAIQGKA